MYSLLPGGPESQPISVRLDEKPFLARADVMAGELQPADWTICVEVLEHLEDPVAGSSHSLAVRNGEQVIDHLRAAGFAVERGFPANAHKPRSPDTPVPAVAAFIVG